MPKIYDFKNINKELYAQKNEPVVLNIPELTYLAVEGKGNPNEQNGDYQKALEVLYGIHYTIKMSKKGENTPKGYFDYVVPPLEGLWWLDTNEIFPIKDKSKFNWISLLRLPDFVTKDIFEWAIVEANRKKKIDTQKAKYLKINEGLCVQILHTGKFDDEPKTIKSLEEFIENNNFINDINSKRKHHEIYLSDLRKVEQSKMKTIIRLPVRKK